MRRRSGWAGRLPCEAAAGWAGRLRCEAAAHPRAHVLARAVGVTWGYHAVDELAEAGADVVAETVPALRHLVSAS